MILAPIELISNIIVRPFTHCVRLFANMFAGHLLLTTFTVAAWYLFSATVIGAIGSAVSFVVVIALTGFEMLIQAPQAYIFTLLAAVYISGRTPNTDPAFSPGETVTTESLDSPCS